MDTHPSISWFFKPNIFYEFYLIRIKLYQAFTRFIPELSGVVMDFGCGAKPYRSLFNCDSYIGVDYLSEGHPHINEQIDVFYDGKKLPFPNDYFDSVFSSEVFEHVFNLPDMLFEIHRVMKPGGQMLFSCPFCWNLHEEPNDFARYTPYALKSMLEAAGFSIVKQERTGNFILCIAQLVNLYFYTHIASKLKNRYVRRSFLVLISVPINLFGLFFSFLLPTGKDLYFNNVILARKV